MFSPAISCHYKYSHHGRTVVLGKQESSEKRNTPAELAFQGVVTTKVAEVSPLGQNQERAQVLEKSLGTPAVAHSLPHSSVL